MTLSAKKSKVVKAIEEVTIKCCRHKYDGGYVVTEIKSISNNNNNIIIIIIIKDTAKSYHSISLLSPLFSLKRVSSC